MLASLRFRLWLTYLLVVGAVVLIIGAALVFYLLGSPAGDRRELQRLRIVAQVALQRRRFFDERGQGLAPLDRLDQVAGRLDGVLGARLIVFDPQGALLVDSRQDSAAAPPTLGELSRPRLQRTAIFRDENNEQWLYVITPLDGGQTLVTATLRDRVQVLTILRDEFVSPFARALIFAVVLSVIMAILFAGWITAPLQRLTEAVHSVARGEFRRIPPSGPRETQQLARSFNDMAERVETSQLAQRDLVANISHDLKTPLTSIQGFAQALLDNAVSGPEDTQRAAQVIYDEAARMTRMLGSLLDMARIDAGPAGVVRAPFDLALLLAGVVQKFKPAAQQAGVELALELNLADTELMMLGDSDRLGQVFDNLLDNALKYTPTGGEVHISVQSGGGWVDIRVADSGPGISPNELERIFERFYQTDKSRRSGRAGAGLGLAIARGIVEAHGGTIRAVNKISSESAVATALPLNPQSGAIFIVQLPLARQDDETLAKRRSETSKTSVNLS